MNLTMQNLINCFNTAIEIGANYIGVAIQIGDAPGKEIIVNGSENFESKLTYYKGAYAEDLTLKFNRTIRIVGFTYGERFKDIGDDLL